MAAFMKPPRAFALLISGGVSFSLFLGCLFVAALSSSSKTLGRPPFLLQPARGACAFVCRGAGFPAENSLRCSSALGSFSSFFKRRKSTPDSSSQKDVQEEQQQQPHHSRFDLYRLMGLDHNVSASAVAARAEQLQQQLQQFPGVPADSLLAELLREVAATLQDPQRRAAFDAEGAVSPSLSKLFDQLNFAYRPPHDVEKEEEEEPRIGEAGPDKEDAVEVPRGPSDLFSALFGGPLLGGRAAAAATRRARQPQQGADVETSITLDFAAAALKGAASAPVTVQRLEPCDDCGGSGWRRGSAPAACESCKGKGVKTETRRSAFGVISTSMTCSDCGGLGRFPAPRCSGCGGHGRQERTVTLKVSVPPGVSDGTLLSVEGQGSAGKDGGERGNLYVTVRVAGDTRLSREGANVHSEETISLAEAATGCKQIVQTVDGEAELTVPPNAQPGQQLVLKGRGARILNHPLGTRGDHVVTLRVALPDTMGQEEQRLLQRFQKGYTAKPADDAD